MSPKKNLLITASAIYPEYQELVGKTQLDEGFSPFFFEFLTIYPRTKGILNPDTYRDGTDSATWTC